MTTYHSVKKEIYIDVAPEKVWRSLTVPSERNKWETQQCSIELKVEGKIDLDYGWGVAYSGTIIEINEHEKLAIEGPDKALTIWTITPQNGGSLVAIEYTGLWARDIGIMEMENMAFGTYQFLRNFKSVLENHKDMRSTFWASWIGVYHRTAASDTGVQVVKVISEAPADGIIQVGDIIHTLNDEVVTSYDEFEKQITEMGPHKEATMEISRKGEKFTIALQTVPYGSKISPASPA